MDLKLITPVILTSNEEANIDRTLSLLQWAERIVVLDSFSSDRTKAICNSYSQVDFYQREFDLHSTQWNTAIDKVTTPWILSLDADYQVNSALRQEVESIQTEGTVTGYAVPFRFAIHGKLLQAHILPPRIALFRADAAHYIQDGHTQDLEIRGKVIRLQQPLIHDDRKPFSRWFRSQQKYVRLEVEKLCQSRFTDLSLQDKVRSLIFPAAPAMVIYTLFVKGLLFSGPAGWRYTAERFIAEALLSLELAKNYLKRS